ncbi:MAG: hypothetical protein OEU90_08740 [Gammaproteobacteria bacterium]|jgi:hypothetical protein|nr:hypothetical protein [Gammaproteobacteria bacterium]MDH3749916.1 hypothetical protein [Gammaproteobacteria bacterium]MDH3805543.1 hypothetical protein [Gammaproteobacteria bacterium]
MKFKSVIALLFIVGAYAPVAYAENLAVEVAELRALLMETRRDYEDRISDLETRLASAEQLASGAKRDASEAFEIAEQTAIDQSSSTSAANTFNPALGAVLSGRYGSVDEAWEEIPGFQPAGEIGTGESGFALGEAEINLKANVDDRFFGNLTFAIADEEGEVEVELEEAWLQTAGLPAGITVTGGRLFSATGYINGFHRHTDDFADRPLPYQAFFGGQYVVDGLQARWIAPTPLLFELGAELNWGSGFPAAGEADSSPGAYTLFAKLGGDVGVSHSWQLGISWLSADALERGDTATFSGDSELAVADFVWKWAPHGNSVQRNLKLQGEYFSRSESGVFDGLVYDGDQTGWYLQGVWQFTPRWRLGLRHDVVDADNGPLLVGTQLEDPGRSSSRDSLMLDWSPSEFSRLRLQYTNDQVLADTGQQWLLQYIMSLGAHGAHAF